MAAVEQTAPAESDRAAASIDLPAYVASERVKLRDDRESNTPVGISYRARSLSVYGMAGQHQAGNEPSQFGTLGVVWSKSLSARFEAQIDFHPLILIDQPSASSPGRRETVPAIALDIGMRWYLAPGRGSIQPYVEMLEGSFGALHRVPGTGTNFNFLTQLGAGAVYLGRAPWQPYICARVVHISNANLGRHNPDGDYWAIGLGSRLLVPEGGQR
jgi:hypothetical protein